jgi:serine/threonine protein kinase
MPLPRGDEYQTAIQNPRVCFLDPELQSCEIEIAQWGLPKPYAGSFTTTYHLHNQSRHWAVRCFTRAVSDLQQRYRAIGRFIARNPEQYFVEANCLLQGIKINGLWIPIIKMKWVEGNPLNIFIEENLSAPSKIRQIADKFLAMTRRLEKLGIAHGDLQHGNILIHKNDLFLIDYDGMYLPELAHLRSNEIGHPNYQHPLRNENHSAKTLDRFSAIVIYLGLTALSVKPQLWKKYNQGENILFRKADFLNPGSSDLLIEMNQLNLPSGLAEKFAGVCLLDFSNIPSLDEFLTGNFNYRRIDFSRYSPARQRKGNTQESGRSEVHVRAGNDPYNTMSWMSQQEIETLERLYGRTNQSSPTVKTASRQSSRSTSMRIKSSIKHPLSSSSRFGASIRRKVQSSVWLQRGERILEITGRIILWFARFLDNLFFYNRPHAFTLESLKRIGLFMFYIGSTITVVVVVVLVIGWLVLQYLP